MAVEMIDKKSKWEGLPASEESLKIGKKVFSEIEESIEYCKKHSEKTKKTKK